MSPREITMTKPDLIGALIPHLVAALPHPFDPDEARAQQVLETAAKWADLIIAESNKGKKVVTMTLG